MTRDNENLLNKCKNNGSLKNKTKHLDTSGKNEKSLIVMKNISKIVTVKDVTFLLILIFFGFTTCVLFLGKVHFSRAQSGQGQDIC